MLRVRSDLALLAAVVLVLAPRLVAPVSAAASSDLRSNQPPNWTAPRRDAGITLRPLWRSDTQRGAATLTYPFDLVFAAQGLAIYDRGEKRVQSGRRGHRTRALPLDDMGRGLASSAIAR
ncbi:MAG: hypothetical protein IPN47_22780 [Gemmatimonadetes bacterium]|nr:hypothetical protein [Gemmatimonadota bacterium]